MKITKYLSDVTISPPWGRYKIDWDRIVSKPQKLVKDFLRPKWQFDRVFEEFVIPGSKFRIDLINLTKMIAVEISPDSVHKNFNKFFHGSRSGLYKKRQADNRKEDWAIKNGFFFVSLSDCELKNLSYHMFDESQVQYPG